MILSLRERHYRYAADGFVIIGNHFPEFDREKDLNALRQEILQLEIPYLVAQDNEGITWRAYNNRYWLSLYLYEMNGDIRYTHIGKGRYEEIESAIQSLLEED